MAKTVNSLHVSGPIVVEHSDERLAAVEEAKRTGQEFQSVASKGQDIVDRQIVAEEVLKVSNENSSDPSDSLPDYLRELMDNADPTEELNKRKAQEHNEVSAEIVAAQQKAEIADREKLRKDPMYFANRIAANNARLAVDHTEKNAAFAKDVARNADGVQEEVRRLRPESVGDPNPITALGQQAQVTDISESAAVEALQTKDKIIFGENSFKAEAQASRTVAKEAESQKRAVKETLTKEPQRIEEPTRKATPPKSQE